MAWEIISELSADRDRSAHRLLQKPEKIEKVLLVLVASDRGLCGGFNSQMIRAAKEFLNNFKPNVEVDVIACGKYAERAMRKLGKNVIAFFSDLANNPAYRDIRPVGKLVIEEFINGKYDQVSLGFTDFVSAINQQPKVSRLLPLEPISGLGEVGNPEEGEKNKTRKKVEYKFEPSPAKVLDMMLPRLVEAQIYQAILESAASEHSARMVAMKSASDSAGEMIDDLTFTFNQARQAGITQEILEISSGKIALENMDK
jgi:F-type H+-transporting ATPase subunit gamma